LEAEKAAAIEQWTHDPCGPEVEGAPGTREFFLRLVSGRRQYAPWMDELYETAAGKDVLDIGCGQGIDLYRFAEVGAKSVTGIDLTPEHVQLATSHLASVGVAAPIQEGDAEQLPFSDASFDLVSSNGVLHHTPDTQAAINEARRVLRPGGSAQIVLYNKSSLHYWTHQLLYCGVVRGRLLAEGSMGGVLSRSVERTSVGARPLVKVYTPREARAMLVAAGLEDVGVRVRQLRWRDSIFAVPLRPFPAALDAIGARAGWYVIATGRVPDAA
jgi:ubiquinone/menaquinone biosynthesis C-methylase UbiE